LIRDRRYEKELTGMRATMAQLHKIIFPENPVAGQLVRMKIGLQLLQCFDNRFGLAGPEFSSPASADEVLEYEAALLDKLPLTQLLQLSAEFRRLAERVLLERGDPTEWEGEEETKNAAEIVAFKLLAGWINCKFIGHTSRSRHVVVDAQAHEELHFDHIRRLLNLLRGRSSTGEAGTDA
jgi:hypothetical protein